MDAVTIKEYKYSKASFLLTISYFRNTFPSILSNFFSYWLENDILDGFDLIQSVIKLQWIPTLVRSCNGN